MTMKKQKLDVVSFDSTVAICVVEPEGIGDYTNH